MKTYKEMVTLFEKVNEQFLSEEYELIKSEVSERTLCAQLMIYLNNQIAKRPSYKNYHVDVEYNRNNGEIKTIIDKEVHVVKINPDLILHSRGKCIEQDNLIALEMKKSTRSEIEKEKDRNRLIALTKDSFDDVWSYDGKTFPEHVCGYLLGIYYEINVNRNVIELEYYQKGQKIQSYMMPIC